jgi:hypothetical protein
MSTVLLLLILGLAGYLVYTIFPAFSDNVSVKQAIQVTANEAWHGVGREELRNRVLGKLASMGSHAVTNATGHLEERPGLGVTDRDVEVVCSDRGQDCSSQDGRVSISVEYVRVVPLPFLKDKKVSLHFHPSASAAMTPVLW